MMQRILSMVVKEFIQLRRDRRSLALVILIPIIQLTLFGYALSTDIKNVPLAIWDTAGSAESRDLIQGFNNQEFFNVKYYAANYDEIAQLLDSGAVRSALIIPPDFPEKLARGESASVQFLVDGSDPNTGLQALNQATAIVQAKGVSIVSQTRGGKSTAAPLDVQSRVLYNPTMKSSIFYLPGIVGLILQMLTVMMTAFAIVRERENGTIEQLNVTPLRRGELVVAKLIPYIIIAYVQITLVVGGAMLVFGMPVRGSLILLFALASVFLMFSLGIGMLISTVSKSQFQAMQLSILMLLPSVILSGFIFPIESMPPAAQWVSAVLPLTYFIRILRGIVVKGVGMEFLWTDTIVLAVMGVIILLLAVSRVRKTLA